MKTIWKYPIKYVDDLTIEMPKGAEILTVQQQHGITCMWALVDPEAEKEKRILEINGTGMPIPCGKGFERKYIGTFLVYEDSLVFHLFERIPEKTPIRFGTNMTPIPPEFPPDRRT